MTPYHVVVILIGAGLEAFAILHNCAADVTAIVALIIGAAAGNAHASRTGQRSTDTPKDGGK